MQPTGDSGTPLLSIVVTIVDGGPVLCEFLRALERQEEPPSIEILVPFDDTIRGEIESLRSGFPSVRFLDMGAAKTIRPIDTAAGQHELYDRRRAAGLKETRGSLIAILEDRAPPRPSWTRTAVRLHEQPYGVIGGAIESAARDNLNWAFYACDFTRYALPFESGPRTWVSDVNVCYKRKVIEDTRTIWDQRFNEARVHWTLLERGETLYLSHELIVDYRTPYREFRPVLAERFHWGRLFGCVRAQKERPLVRMALIALSPLIPIRLVLRHGWAQTRKGNFGRFLSASPIMLLLCTAWTTGEAWGYITREP